MTYTPIKLQIPLDSNHEFAAALGRLLGHWAIVEHELTDILGILLRVNQPRAQMIFMTFISFKAKLQLIERLIHNFVGASPEKNRLLSLIRSAGNLNDERNGFIHATWGVGNTNDSLTRFPNTLQGNTKNAFRATDDLTPQDIQKVVDTIASLSGELQHFRFHDAAKLVIHQVPPSWMHKQVE